MKWLQQRGRAAVSVARRMLGLAVPVVALSCSGKQPVGSAPKPAPAPLPAFDAPAAPTKAVAARGVNVLFADSWPGSVRLLGIDPKNHHAMLTLEARAPQRAAIDIIDYKDGKRVERWEATPELAEAPTDKHRGFRPFSGTFEQDLVRYGGLLRATGPWHTRDRAFGPTVATSADGAHLVYGGAPNDGTDGDWLYLVDRTAFGPRRIDNGVKASYSPVFSPDGARIAWRGCTISPCGYSIYVAKLGGAPEKINGIVEAGPPVWSRDGNAVYAVSRPKKGKQCLYRVAAETSWEVKPVTCVEGLHEVEFRQDAEGRTGVLSGWRGYAGYQSYEYWWFLVANGEMLGHRTVPFASGAGLLSTSGLLAIPLQRGGLGIIDLVMGRVGAIRAEGHWFYGLETTQWIDDSRLVLLCKTGESFPYELVEVNAREAEFEEQ